MPTYNFFEEQSEQSFVKSQIVSKYFDAWAGVIIGAQVKGYTRSEKIAYIDLFAGPGRYRDGTISTPIKIIEKALSNPKYSKRLVCLFNDKDEKNSFSLERAIADIPGIENLKYKPKVYSQEVGTEIVKMFEEMRLIPTLFFVDPWGYKGLSLRLINSVLKDWGCDCIFFFNYNRINMGLTNTFVKQHIDVLFGENAADKVRAKIYGCANSKIREFIIIEELCQALKKLGGRYTLPFRFKNAQGHRTSHHLIFVSKSFTGYDIMKEIMAKESSSHNEGVPSFEYNPVDKFNYKQGLLFKLTSPLEQLGNMLIDDFAGQTISMGNLYETHSVDTPFIRRNYRKALLQMEVEGRVSISKHRANTLADDKLITFTDKKWQPFHK